MGWLGLRKALEENKHENEVECENERLGIEWIEVYALVGVVKRQYERMNAVQMMIECFLALLEPWL